MWKFVALILASAALQTAVAVVELVRRGDGATHKDEKRIGSSLEEQKSFIYDDSDVSAEEDDKAAVAEEAAAKAEAAEEGEEAEVDQAQVQEKGKLHVISGRPFGPIPKKQKPFWAFLLFAIIGLVGYSLNQWRMRYQNQQQRKMRMGDAGAATWETADANDVREPAQKGKGAGKVGKGFGKALGKSTGKAGGKGKGSKGPQEEAASSTLINNGTFSMSKLYAFLPFLANRGLVDSGSKDEAPGGKATGRGNKGRASESMMKDLIVLVRSVEKIQAVWRRFKASQPAPPKDNQRITVVCDVLEGKDMPNVNRFGGCDPLVECRIVKGDPTLRLRGDLDKDPLFTAQTGEKRNDMAPSWNQKLTLTDLTYDKDMYVQLVLWDYNIKGNKPIGHVALPLHGALASYGTKRAGRALSFTSLPGCDELQLKATVSAQFSFLETPTSTIEG